MSDNNDNPFSDGYKKGWHDAINSVRTYLQSDASDPTYRLGASPAPDEHLSNARLKLFGKLSELSSRQ